MNERRTPKALQPKVRFLKEQTAGDHAKWVASEAAKVAIETALADMTMQLPRPNGLEEACRFTYELLGARRFIDILLNLAEPDMPGFSRPNDNLAWNQPLKPNPRPTSSTNQDSRQPKA